MDDVAQDLFCAIDRIRQGRGYVSPVLLKDLEENSRMIPNFLKFVMDA